MPVTRPDRIQRQHGMTLWSLLYVASTLGMIALVLIRSVPVYLTAYDVRRTLEATAADLDLRRASAVQLQNAAQRRFDAGYVDIVRGRDIVVRRVANGHELFIAYEVRRPLLFNLSLVYSFEDRARIAGGQTGDPGG